MPLPSRLATLRPDGAIGAPLPVPGPHRQVPQSRPGVARTRPRFGYGEMTDSWKPVLAIQRGLERFALGRISVISIGLSLTSTDNRGRAATGLHREVRMNCPICTVQLKMAGRQGVEVNYCPDCRECGSTAAVSTRLSTALSLKPQPPAIAKRTGSITKTTGTTSREADAGNPSFPSCSIEGANRRMSWVRLYAAGLLLGGVAPCRAGEVWSWHSFDAGVLKTSTAEVTLHGRLRTGQPFGTLQQGRVGIVTKFALRRKRHTDRRVLLRQGRR